MNRANRRSNSGYLVVLLLVFGSIFFVIFTTFMGFTITQKQISTAKKNSDLAFSIAEAGLNYYKWYLSHNPGDATNGTSTPGPYVVEYSDPEGGVVGSYSLNIDGHQVCGETTYVDIYSTGYTSEDPNIQRTLYARYSLPNVASYSHIVGSNVWAGDDREIYGPYHSNGFVRMDGVNYSEVTSGQTSADCGDVDVCSDSYPTGYTSGTQIDGVFGEGSGSDLWSWSQPTIDFDGITVDLSSMETKAQSSGEWFDASGDAGYYVLFNSDGTFTVKTVKESKAKGNAYGHSKNFLNSAQTVGTYSIPSGCSVLFFKDNVWVEGTIVGKVTLAAADPADTNFDPTAMIVGNITYSDDDSGLLLVGEEDVLIGLDVPEDMTIEGVFMAVNGWFGRKHYVTYGNYNTDTTVSIQSNQSDHIIKDSLTTYGTVVSNGRVGTKWVYAGGATASGFEQRYDYYDRDLALDPPPLTPNTSENYQFLEWREE